MKKSVLWVVAGLATIGLVACDTANDEPAHSAETSANVDDTNRFDFLGDAEVVENESNPAMPANDEAVEEDTSEDWWNRTVEDVEEGYENFKEAADEFAEDVKEKSGELWEDVEEAYEEFKDDVKEWHNDEKGTDSADNSTE